MCFYRNVTLQQLYNIKRIIVKMNMLIWYEKFPFILACYHHIIKLNSPVTEHINTHITVVFPFHEASVLEMYVCMIEKERANVCGKQSKNCCIRYHICVFLSVKSKSTSNFLNEKDECASHIGNISNILFFLFSRLWEEFSMWNKNKSRF